MWRFNRRVLDTAVRDSGKARTQACLVNARHMKNVPGRRTDWHDCQWIQYLHSVGLLRSAFRSADEVCAVRVIMRHRGELVAMAAQHIQKAPTQMNLQLHHVINDITGLTGLTIVDAILEGERDPAKLAQGRYLLDSGSPYILWSDDAGGA